MPEVPQEDLRRRLRAARALGGFSTVAELAERIPESARLGERTLRKLESGESVLTPPILRELAVALGVGYEWFTVPDLARAIAAPDPALAERVASLEAALQMMESSHQELWRWAQGEGPAERPGAARRVAPASANATGPSARRHPRRSK